MSFNLKQRLRLRTAKARAASSHLIFDTRTHTHIRITSNLTGLALWQAIDKKLQSKHWKFATPKHTIHI